MADQENVVEVEGVVVEAQEEVAQDAEAVSPETDIHKLLEDARAKADDHWDQLLRTKAEMDNLRRRAERDVESAHKYAIEKFCQELLPVIDSMEMGINAATDDADVAKLKEGMEMTFNMLTGAVGKFGVEVVDPIEQPFNPDLHQAISMQPNADLPPNTVMAVMQKGYSLNGRLVRPAMVVVTQS